MKQFLLRLIRLMSGYFIYAIGIVFCLQGNLGYSPWDILNNGFSLLVGCSFDAASIPIGFILLVAPVLCKQKIGLGTVGNMILNRRIL